MLPKKPGGRWIGLAKTSGGYELKEYALKITKTKKTGIEDYPVYRISTAPRDKLVFLIRGLDRLTPGPVQAAKPVAESIFVWEKRQLSLVLGAASYRLSTGCVERRRQPHENVNNMNKYYSCKLQVTGPANARFSIDYASGEHDGNDSWRPYTGVEKLLWAGDLDRDGKLDFLLQEVARSETFDTLYLSSLAPQHGMVGQAASIHHVWVWRASRHLAGRMAEGSPSTLARH